VGGIGHTRVLVDGEVAGEGVTTHPARDVVFVLSQPPEVRVPIELRAGQAVDIRVEHQPDVHGRQAGFVTLRLGIAADVDDDALMIDAVTQAAAADVPVVVVGSADGTESEGYDRDTMSLPGRQDELISRVAAANPNTVVVVNSGMPVLMPWAGEVAAVIQAWFPGQAFGEALADVLSGAAEPGGRLPVSIPRAEADSPVLTAFPDGGRLSYDEGLLVGYRGYDRAAVEPLFAFGHGLGYADWVYESIEPASRSLAAGEDMQVVVRVRNAGSRPSREVVQVYLEGPGGDPSRPLRTLAAFAVVTATGGESAEAHLTIPARSFMTYDGAAGAWVPRPGVYSLRAGRSSRDLILSTEVVMR
jgi:beta-glucosidase